MPTGLTGGRDPTSDDDTTVGAGAECARGGGDQLDQAPGHEGAEEQRYPPEGGGDVGSVPQNRRTHEGWPLAWGHCVAAARENALLLPMRGTLLGFVRPVGQNGTTVVRNQLATPSVSGKYSTVVIRSRRRIRRPRGRESRSGATIQLSWRVKGRDPWGSMFAVGSVNSTRKCGNHTGGHHRPCGGPRPAVFVP